MRLLHYGRNDKMRINEWIDRQRLEAFEVEGTNAQRVCTIDNAWAERFGADVLISFRLDAARDRLVTELQAWSKSIEFRIDRVFGRFLPKKSEERERAKLLSGSDGESLQTVVTENHL